MTDPQEVEACNMSSAKDYHGIYRVQLTTIVLCWGTSQKQTGGVRVLVGDEFQIKISFCKV